jgi:hypothetical protein
MRISGVGSSIASARPPDLDAARVPGVGAGRSSITIAARPLRATAPYFFVRAKSCPPTSIVSCSAL